MNEVNGGLRSTSQSVVDQLEVEEVPQRQDEREGAQALHHVRARQGGPPPRPPENLALVNWGVRFGRRAGGDGEHQDGYCRARLQSHVLTLNELRSDFSKPRLSFDRDDTFALCCF